jgi:hypothetical protein
LFKPHVLNCIIFYSGNHIDLHRHGYYFQFHATDFEGDFAATFRISVRFMLIRTSVIAYSQHELIIREVLALQSHENKVYKSITFVDCENKV